MQFVRCDACGAKAILAASRCPKCANPFWLRNHRGDIIPLSRCRDCNTWFPRSKGACKWCGVPAPVRRRPAPWLGAAAVVLLAGLVVWRSPLIDSLSSSGEPAPMSEGPRPQAPVAHTEVDASVPPSEGRGADQSLEAQSTLPPAGPQEAPTGAAAGVGGGDGPWTSMRANTWVNVRRTTGGQSAVLGVINPDEEVLLGQSRGGWRRVRSGRLSGWVDSRLFRP